MAAKSSRPEQTIENNEQMNARQSTMMRFPDSPFPHSMLLIFEDYKYDKFKSGDYETSLSNQKTGIIGKGRASGIGLRSSMSIELPFPRQLLDNTGLIYNNMQQNPLIEGAVQSAMAAAAGDGGALKEIPQAIANAGGGAAAYLKGNKGGLGAIAKELVKGSGETSTADAASMTRFMLSKFIPDSLGSQVNLAAGQALNPRETLSFEGVQLKTHTFNWDLFPANENDSAKIKDIIEALKTMILPDAVNIGTGDKGIKKAFLKFPKTCKIHLIGVDETYYMKFKPCMVTAMTVDYGAGGTLGIMAGGRPAGVNIALTLQELQIETTADYGVSATSEPGVPAEDLAINHNEDLYPDTQGGGGTLV